MNDTDRDKTLGLIVAGGSSHRFGGDKALAMLGGRRMLDHVVARLGAQVGALALNASGDPAGTSLPLVPDDEPGEGPLGGLLTGMRWASVRGFPFVAAVPCDTPFFPLHTVVRLHESLSGGGDCAVATCEGRAQHAFVMVRTTCLARVADSFQAGARRLRCLGDVLRCAYADFSGERHGPQGDAFFNINTLDDLNLASRWLEENGVQ